MKIKSILMGALVALVACTTGAFAQSLPIQSPDLVRQAGLKSVTHGSRGVYSESIDYNYEGTVTSLSSTGNGAEEVLDSLFGKELVYKVTNPDDLINGYVWLYDKDDNLVFYGYAQFTAKGYLSEKPQYSIWQQYLPLLSGVESAEIITLDDENHTANSQSLYVRNGHIMFEPWYAGRPNGKLVVKFQDGTTLVYDLANPVGQETQVAGGGGSYKIDGHYVFDLGDKEVPVKIIEIYERPTALLRVSLAQQVVIDVVGIVQEQGLSQERPDSMDVSVEGKDGIVTVQLNVTGTTSVYFGIGHYRILRFNWSKFGLPGKLYVPGNYDGKG
jgi:hypothetical protein